MYKRQILFCFLAQLTIVKSATTASSDLLTDSTPRNTATTPSINISPDFTSTSTTFATGTIISFEATYTTTTAGQCVYNGQTINDGENVIANDYCQSSCWCMGSQMICTTCPPQNPTSTTSSTISPDTSTTPTTLSIGIVTDTTPKSTVAGQCLYYGQLYNEGDVFQSIDDCNTCSCGWFGTTCTLLFCPNIYSTSTTSSTISPDTSTTPTPTTSGTISPDTSTTPMEGQCVYNGQVYNDGDNFIANDYCQSYCWCMGSQMICTMCPTRTPTPPTSSTISTDTSTTPMEGQCVYNGQVYKDGDNFIANDYCQSYCWCMGSQMICTMCPTRTPTPPTSSTISPDTGTTPMEGQCVYNGQVYNDGDNFIANDYCQSYCWCMGSQMICTMCPTRTPTPPTSSTISPDTSTTPTLTTSSMLSPDTTTTTTPTRSTTLSPYISRSTNTKQKRRRTTLPPALYTNTKKIQTDVFDTITKKPHFTTHDFGQFGSKRTAIPKGNRKNVEIR